MSNYEEWKKVTIFFTVMAGISWFIVFKMEHIVGDWVLLAIFFGFIFTVGAGKAALFTIGSLLFGDDDSDGDYSSPSYERRESQMDDLVDSTVRFEVWRISGNGQPSQVYGPCTYSFAVSQAQHMMRMNPHYKYWVQTTNGATVWSG